MTDAPLDAAGRLLYFPVPAAGETIRSMVGRYWLNYAATRGGKVCTSRLLFGRGTTHINPAVPFGLTHFVERIPSCLGLDLERVLARHTLYPVLRLLLPSFSALKIGAAVEAGTGVRPNAFGIDCSERHSRDLDQFCRACYWDDIDRVGVPVWHREHQIPGVTVCFAHGLDLMFLESDAPEVRRPVDPFALPALPTKHDSTQRRAIERGKSAPASTRHWAFAKFCADLLVASMPCEFSRSRPEFLRQKLGSDPITMRSLVDVAALSQDIVVRWTAPELVRLGLSGTELKEGGWLRPWLTKTCHSAPALQGLLLLEHCFASAGQLAEEWHDFHNPTSSQSTCARKRADCDGTRLEELLRRLTSPSRTHVHEIRPLIDQMQRLFDVRRRFPRFLSARADERRLSAEATVIRSAIRSLGGRRSTNYERVERRLAYIEAQIPTYKQDILAYVARTPSASRSNVVRKKSTACIYVRAYDPAWYQEAVHERGVLPREIAPRHGRPTSITSVRQITQDDERASRSIRAAYNELLAFDGSPSQITKTALLRQARLDRALTRLRRLPKTLKLIQECIETPEQYFRRRLRWGLRELQRDGVPISRNRLMKMGCFSTRYTYLFDEMLSSFPDAVLDPRSIKAA